MLETLHLTVSSQRLSLFIRSTLQAYFNLRTFLKDKVNAASFKKFYRYLFEDVILIYEKVDQKVWLHKVFHMKTQGEDEVDSDIH